MKYYFAVIITVLIVVVVLLFFILYKIYKLHINSKEDIIDYFEKEELLSSYSGSKSSSGTLSNGYEIKEHHRDDVSGNSVELIDGSSNLQGKQEVEMAHVQPDVKELVGTSLDYPDSPKPFIPKQQSLKQRSYMKLLLHYDKSRSILKVIVKHIDGKLKSKHSSSESYLDVQVSSYQFRTYRSPGYRRPARIIIKKPIEFRLDMLELKNSFLLVFLLRYDPFSRLKIDGEVVVKLSDVLNDPFVDGVQVELSKEIMKSKQDFTAFILRTS